ncbi:MAG: NAD(P)-dependent oxidoreductase [Pseudomonadota bacterium]
MKIAWIGTGKLGAPMAHRAAEAHEVVAFDTVQANLEGFAHKAVSIAEAVVDAEAVITTIPNDAVLAAVATEALPALGADAIFVDMSTVSPEGSAKVADMAGATAYIRAPVSGSVMHAEKGILTVLASGPTDAYDRLKPVFETFSAAMYHVGAGEEARYLKLVINNMVGSTAALLAESLTLGRKGGLDWKLMLDVLSDSAVASPLVKFKAEPLKARHFAPAFTAEQMIKDIGLVVDAAQMSGTETPLAAQTLKLMQDTAAAGMAHEDFVAAVKTLEARAGLGEPE